MPRRAPADVPVLSLRELNRALLARQLLLRRARVDVVTGIERLAALQAQWPKAPYVGLWSRLARFERDDLEEALRRRLVVKASLMRGTLHLASAADYPYYAVAAREARRATWPSIQSQLLRTMARAIPDARVYVAKGGAGVADAAKMHETLLRHAARPRSRDELVDLFARANRMPREVAVHLVWNYIAAHGMLVHEPESAFFGQDRAGNVIAARVALKALRVPDLDAAVAHTVRRYLAAYGPATTLDISSWTSMRATPIRGALETMAAELRMFRDERGRELYDLARAPRPDPDEPAPARYLPKWDSTLLAYTPEERVRILPERHRRTVILKNGDVAQTFLVDGVVAGTWTLVRDRAAAVVRLTPFARLAKADRAELVDEGERLARFLAPDARGHAVRA